MYRNATTCLMAPVLRKRASRRKSRGAETDSRDVTEGIRHDLVARVRAEIASGAYETEEKLRLAMDRLLGDLSRE